MSIRRKFSFELLRSESSGDEVMDSKALKTSPANGAVATKSHSRKRRHKSSKKRPVNSTPVTVDNGQIYCNNRLLQGSENSFNLRKCSSVDTGFLAECLMEVPEMFASEELETGNGAIAPEFDHHYTCENLKTLTMHTGGSVPNGNGFVHFDRAVSAGSECMDLDVTVPHSDALSIVEDVSNNGSPGGLEQISLNNSTPRAVEQVLSVPELRQRNLNAFGLEETLAEVVEREVECSRAATPSVPPPPTEKASDNERKGFLTPTSLDWERLMSESSDYPPQVRVSPLGYFLREIKGGNSLRSTTSVGNDKKRQRVYNTMFHVPWRCELLIDVGFFVCLDSFLSLLTIMPARVLVFLWRYLKVRQFQRPFADELSDFGSFLVLISGVALLQVTDISLIYHFIRGQGTIKLYVVYNVLEIFDKLCQSFGGDVLQVLFNSAEGVANSSTEYMTFETVRFIVDQVIAIVAFIVHSFIILAQAITLSAAIISNNNALMALLVSNNFAEVKSNVFKRVSEENLHKMAYYDTVERFHIMAYIIFVLAQNILEAQNPWLWSFARNSFMIWGCEVLVDVIKHAFLAKFNEIRPAAYSEFLEALCKQTLNSESREIHKTLTFVPLAPACVVIRILTPIYAARLPLGPVWWRWFWLALLFSGTYFMLACLKVIVGLGLQTHARWYVRRCLRKKRHLHAD